MRTGSGIGTSTSSLARRNSLEKAGRKEAGSREATLEGRVRRDTSTEGRGVPSATASRAVHRQGSLTRKQGQGQGQGKEQGQGQAVKREPSVTRKETGAKKEVSVKRETSVSRREGSLPRRDGSVGGSEGGSRREVAGGKKEGGSRREASPSVTRTQRLGGRAASPNR